MVNLGAWIGSLVPSLVGRVMAALGFGILTVTGITLAWDALRASMYAQFGQIPATMLSLMSLSGAGDAIGIIVGAISARVALYVLQQGKKIVGMP